MVTTTVIKTGGLQQGTIVLEEFVAPQVLTDETALTIASTRVLGYRALPCEGPEEAVGVNYR